MAIGQWGWRSPQAERNSVVRGVGGLRWKGARGVKARQVASAGCSGVIGGRYLKDVNRSCTNRVEGLAASSSGLHLSWFVLMATLCSASLGTVPVTRGVGGVGDLVCAWAAGSCEAPMAWSGATGPMCVLPEESPGRVWVWELVVDHTPRVGLMESVLPPPGVVQKA